MVDEEKESSSIFSFIKSATQYSVLLLLCIILFILLFIGTKDKINVNFSKKSNKRILIGVLLILSYIFRSSFNYWYEEIKLDANKPGDGVIGNTINSGKDKIIALNNGYLGDKYEELKDTISELQAPIEMNDSVNQEVANQLKYEGALGYLITEDGSFYSVKPNTLSRNKYILESKLDRSTMQVKTINIDETNKEYIDVYKSKKYVENLLVDTDINTILVAPSMNDSSNKDDTDEEKLDNMCKKCKVKNLSTIESNAFSFIDSNQIKGSFPKCVKIDTGREDSSGNKIIDNNCCIIEESGTRFGCPDVCFNISDEQKEKEPSSFTPNEYMTIIKSNTSCSNINVPIVNQKAQLDLTDITDELDYNANKLSDWRTDDNWEVDLSKTDNYMSDIYKN